jgi:hypothetical protein
LADSASYLATLAKIKFIDRIIQTVAPEAHAAGLQACLSQFAQKTGSQPSNPSEKPSARACVNDEPSRRTYLETAVSNIRPQDWSKLQSILPADLALAIAEDDANKAWLSRIFYRHPDPEISAKAAKISGCGSSHMVLSAIDHDRAMLIPYVCNQRVCPGCARRRTLNRFVVAAKTVSQAATAAIDHGWDFRLLTLTVRNCKPGALAETLDNLWVAFRQFRRKSALWPTLAAGYIFNFEITHSRRRQDWHPHIHVLCLGHYVSQARLAHDWSGYAARQGLRADPRASADIRLVRDQTTDARETDPTRAILEVTKYTLKPLDSRRTPAAAVVELSQALHKRRMTGSGGTLTMPGPPRDLPAAWEWLGGLGALLSDIASVPPELATAILAACERNPGQRPELIRRYPWLAAYWKDRHRDD